MAGPAQRGPRGRERSPRRGSSSPSAALSGAAAGRITAPTSSPRRATTTRPASQATPEEQLITRSTYRLLLMRGLAPDEAANVTAFLCGIPVADVHWSLRQVNDLLFLRAMARTGRFGPSDGDPPRPH